MSAQYYNTLRTNNTTVDGTAIEVPVADFE